MRTTIKILIVAIAMMFISTSTLIAEEKKKITIEEMEVHLATLGTEIAKDKVRIYRKEALLNEMKLDLIKKKRERDSRK